MCDGIGGSLEACGPGDFRVGTLTCQQYRSHSVTILRKDHSSLLEKPPLCGKWIGRGWAKMKAGRWLLLQAWNYEGCSEERAVEIEIRALV